MSPDLEPLISPLFAYLDQRQTSAEPLDSRRLFHGRGRCFPDLEFVCLDWYEPLLLLTLYAEPPEGWLAQVRQAIEPRLAPAISCLLVQRRYASGAPSECLWGQLPERGQLPEQVYARLGELRFELSFAQQQNCGFFLDMAPGRQWLTQQARGKRVLNLFAYTCALSVVAVAAGAERVVNVDMSSRALNWGRRNHQLNGLDKARSEFLAEDILKSWGRIKKRGPYDVVIFDPPSFQPGSFVATKDYAKLVRRIPELMPEGGQVLACLNAPELTTVFLRDLFASECPGAQLEERLTPSPDFSDINPEQQLKLLVFRYQP